jgi:probable F420-dependent oxidoreductase
MPHDRRFRFGVQVATAPTGEDWATLARRAESLGYSTLFMPDHFEDQLAPVPALMAAAAATTELRVGTLVFDNDYRHPVVLAKEAATLDVLTGGRLELGLGAGWMRTDYEQAGMSFDENRVRVDRMEEGLAVLKGLFAEGPFSFEGDHYRIDGLDGLPKPRTRPHPPFLIGGGGRRVLGIAAREADIVGINPALRSGAVDEGAAADATAAATDRKLAWVREAAGERFDDLEINCLSLATVVTTSAAERDGVLEAMGAMFGLDPAAAGEVPHAVIGSVDEIVDALEARRERWAMSYVTVQGDALEAFAPVVARLAGT